MQPEQAIVAAWMQRVLLLKGWTPETWAKEADVSPTTITRAMKPEYPSVSATKTLDGLARAAEVPSILDFLQRDDPAAAVDDSARVPSESSLAGLLAAVLPLVPSGRQTARSLRVVAAALSHGLELLGDQSSNPNNEGALGAAARGAAARFRDLTRQ